MICFSLYLLFSFNSLISLTNSSILRSKLFSLELIVKVYVHTKGNFV
jgi:hypothetical protein